MTVSGLAEKVTLLELKLHGGRLSKYYVVLSQFLVKKIDPNLLKYFSTSFKVLRFSQQELFSFKFTDDRIIFIK
jgi:hypothetical protein